MEAIRQGINYFDTAYVYKNNEKVLGRILAENNCRDQIYIATKLPQYMVRSVAQAEKIFNQELELLQTDHIDYYLMHMLNDLASWNRLKAMGLEDWIKEKMVSGKIRNIGFSYHGNTENFKPVVDVFDWDFCQIQYNYLDENIQAGKRVFIRGRKRTSSDYHGASSRRSPCWNASRDSKKAHCKV